MTSDLVSQERLRGFVLAGHEANKMSDEKKNIFTKIIGKINLTRYRSYLLTQLISHRPHKIIPEDCNMLSNIRGCLEKVKISKRN
jgi:hypothetical protein